MFGPRALVINVNDVVVKVFVSAEQNFCNGIKMNPDPETILGFCKTSIYLELVVTLKIGISLLILHTDRLTVRKKTTHKQGLNMFNFIMPNPIFNSCMFV